MNRRNILSLSAITVFGLAVLPGKTVAQQSDTDKVKAAIDNFHAALSALDIKKMDDVWAHDSDVMLINPRDKTGPSIGWDAVRRNWEAVFAVWSELKVTQKDGPHIHINGNVAWADATAAVAGKPKTGDPVTSAPTFESTVLEKRGDRWVFVSHSAWRVPQ
jgi:ketosteroid isomerase-like protein